MPPTATRPQPPPDAPEAPARVFGVMGAPFTIAGREFHFARFTTAGVRSIMAALSREGALPILFAEGASTGEMVAEAVVLGRQGAEEAFERFLALVAADQVPAGLLGEAEPDEIAACVDTFLNQAGFRLMDATLKNYAARKTQRLMTELVDAAERAIEQEQSEEASSEPTTTAPASTSSTK